MQVSIYATQHAPRLAYTCQFIFKEWMGVDFSILTARAHFAAQPGPKIFYDNSPAGDGYFTIGNNGLLFEKQVHEKQIDCFDAGAYKAFFKTEGADLRFDIFAAVFYLLSRYEEYLPHQEDAYGRYAHGQSLAFKENFLHLPLVDQWLTSLFGALQKKFPGVFVSSRSFRFVPTYDIDMAFSFKQKGWKRNAGGFLRSPSPRRLKVLAGMEKDPFDSYDWLNQIHDRYGLQPIYFFLLAARNGMYDKNVLPAKPAMKQLVPRHAKKYTVGIHPSWQSGDQPGLLQKEKQTLEDLTGLTVTRSRQHYIRFNLPEGYRKLLEAGITDDYSMGYGSINGFRASTACSFYWYDLQKEEATSLRVHPFCFMDANSFYEEKLSAVQAYDELMTCYNLCKNLGLPLSTIWHNNFLGTDPLFKGWREVYEEFIKKMKGF